MRAVIRLLGVGIVGVVLYYVGQRSSALLVRPDPIAAILVVTALAISLVLLAYLVSGTGRGDAAVTTPGRFRAPMRALSLVVAAYAVLGVVMFSGILRPSPPDTTPYRNDAMAIDECAARMLVRGEDPYSNLDLFACYDELGIGPDRTTPLWRGLFANMRVYPSDAELQAVWDVRRADPASNVEFEWRPSYPALSFVLLLPWALGGFDPNVLSTLCLLAAMGLILLRTERSLRGLMATALLANVVAIAWTIGGSSDLLYALPLIAAWLWRDRRWSAVLVGVACATKQLAWFAVPYYLLATWRERGWRVAAARGAIAFGVFVLANLPFIARDPRAWLAGIATPLVDPMFPRGTGLVLLSTDGALPLFGAVTYLALELVAFAACFLAAWRAGRRSPEMGLVLAYVPLFFAWRSLFSYFFLLPLFAAAAIARLPVGAFDPAHARTSGAVALVEAPRVPAT